MDKQIVVHPYNGIPLAIKRKELLSHEKTWRKPKCMLLSERNQSKKLTKCVILNMTFWEWPNSRDCEKNACLAGMGEG